MSEKPRTLGAKNVNLVLNEGGISCSYAFLGIFEAILEVKS